MLDTLLVIFSICSIAWFIRESYLLSGLRRWLMNKSELFLEFFSCPYCVGIWSGLFVYFLHENNFDIRNMALWAFAGGTINYLYDLIVIRLTVSQRIKTVKEFEEDFDITVVEE